MGKKKQKQPPQRRQMQQPQQPPSPPATDLLDTLTDFTSQENWDKFFTLRGSDDAFEWYAEWPEIKGSLLSELRANLGETSPAAVQILVPGCGNSKLSEHLYDAGFHAITNIDFSKVVISDMLRRNVRDRPKMLWRVMDMTSMQLPNDGFDSIVDKGGLDALMEPQHGEKLGSQYLKEVQRVLKTGGKFICLTLAESHVLELLLPTFRFGWKMAIHRLPQKSSGKPDLRTFMVVAEKGDTLKPEQITTTFTECLSLIHNDKQVNGLFRELNSENFVRDGYLDADVLLSLKDLRLGAKGDLACIMPGRQFSFVLGDESSRFSYRTVLLDAKQDFDIQSLCGVMLVPKPQASEWMYSSEEGPWMVVENAKVARLLMVYLDSIHLRVPMEELQHDLSSLVKQLVPAGAVHSQIPFMMVQDTVKTKKLVHQASSTLTGQIIVDDVAYDNTDNAVSQILPCSAELRCRRLIFQRSSNLVQSEALIDMPSVAKDPNEEDKKNNKSKKKGGQESHGVKGSVKINHDYLASEYHSGIISGFILISSYLETMGSAGNGVRTVVIGLGAGLLPMFLHGCLPFTLVESVELDPIIAQLARDYFGFCEDARLKVHLTDGIKFIEGVASNVNAKDEKGELLPSSEKPIDILIVDVDSDDPCLGLSCPAQGFVDESFLNDARASLSDQGLLVINLVTRSSSTKEEVISRVRKIFSILYTLELEEDVNQIFFALKTNEHIPEDKFPEAVCKLKKLLNCREPEMTEAILDASTKIRYLG